MQKYHAVATMFAMALALSMPLQAWESQILACSYYDKIDDSVNSSIFHAGLPWVWAKGVEGENIFAHGRMVDGFFQVASLSGYKDCLDPELVDIYENSTKSARVLCERAIAAAFPDDFQNKIVMNMMVKSSFLSISHSPPVFQDKGQRDPKDINKIVIFGDSLSDQDNLKTWVRILPNAPYFGGRFTNGPNWVDHIHLETGAAVQNLAVGGAITAIEDFAELRFSTKISGSVEDQINRFKEEIEDKKISDPNSTLFVIWAGGNDYLSMFFSDQINTFIDEPSHTKWGSDIVVIKIVNNILNHVQTLYDIGARKFVLINMPDLGTLPQVLDLNNYEYIKKNENSSKLFRLSKRLTQVTLQHNQGMTTGIDNFVKANPEVNIIYGDVYTGVRNVVLSRHFLNPAQYFSYKLDPDFIMELKNTKKTIHVHRACFSGDIWSSNLNASVCATPNRSLFWDKIHPTSFGHCLVALNLQRRLHQNNLMSAPEPNNYFQRCQPDLKI